ncbi:MAG: BrnA antitoxin family protein [Acidovorax sp.]
MTKQKAPEMSQFEQDLLESVRQALRGEGRVTTGEEIVRRTAGRPRQDVHKQPVTLRLEPDALAAWRATGKGWQTRAAQVLADWAKTHASA